MPGSVHVGFVVDRVTLSFSLSFPVFPISIILPWLNTHIVFSVFFFLGGEGGGGSELVSGCNVEHGESGFALLFLAVIWGMAVGPLVATIQRHSFTPST
jgi:hypothetical protein